MSTEKENAFDAQGQVGSSDLRSAAATDTDGSVLADVAIFYSAELDEVYEWHVKSRTPRTWTVERTINGWHPWRRVIRKSDVGSKFFDSPVAALNALAGSLRDEIGFAQAALHRKRTALGMVESQIKNIAKAEGRR